MKSLLLILVIIASCLSIARNLAAAQDSPVITGVVDVPNDQGGWVRLVWSKAGMDTNAPPFVTSYQVFRRSPVRLSMNIPQTPDGAMKDSSFTGYDYILSIPALRLPTYQCLVSTLEDSGLAGARPTFFRVLAQTQTPGLSFASDPDSGYSIDNLAPAEPAGLSALAAGVNRVRLKWDAATDVDFSHFNLYRSTSADSLPSWRTLIGSPPAPFFTDSSISFGANYFYRVTAIDIHGNESLPSDTVSFNVMVNSSIRVMNRWNMVSIPLTVNDYGKNSLFPRAVSGAFLYANGYHTTGTLKSGLGYWVKFPDTVPVPLGGLARVIDTVDVAAGWNMVGSLSSAFPVTNIVTIPDGIMGSKFFAYTGTYTISATIEPGKGYWIKVKQPGKLIMRMSTSE